jgi:2-keto-4-pentenoate hydratase/2-oxohepta-3-ene-1,7-dioic acid hydratase in catechol pathway
MRGSYNRKAGEMMNVSRRTFLSALTAGYPALHGLLHAQVLSGVKHYVRFQVNGRIAYGLLKDKIVHELNGAIFDRPTKNGRTYPLAAVKLLAPCQPTKVLAVALNYASHLGDRPKPKNPELFFKAPSAILEPGGSIVIPPGTNRCDYEGELVVVIGKKAKDVSAGDAPKYIFGVTCGNDVSARDWQENDIQWWRAKGSDTFAPLGPAIAQGLNYNDLLLTTRLNGEVKQRQRTSDLFFSVDEIVSFLSRFVTLYPGDVIYTGTPGKTSAMKSGDVVEVEIEGIGILKNRVV